MISEDAMQRNVMKQVLLLVLMTVVLVLLMGFWLVTAAKAEPPQAPLSGNGKTIFTENLISGPWDDWDEDEDEAKNEDKAKDEGLRKRRRHKEETALEVSYNRVTGIYLGVKLDKADRGRSWERTRRQNLLFGSVGYALKAKDFLYRAGLEKGFFKSSRMTVGGEYHHQILTPDVWIMPDDENSVAAILIKEDFRDYYQAEGASGWISQKLFSNVKISATYLSEKTESLERNTNYALFGGKKKFRENPPMDAGQFKTLTGRIVVDTRNSVRRTTRGWYIQAEGEHAGGGLGGDFEFDRYLADVRRYQPLGYGEGVDVRLRAGTSHGDLPWERTFWLGGVSTLRGFKHKAFPAGWKNPGGNRMLLAQIEYRMGREDLPDALDLGLLEEFNLIAFTDAGWVGQADPEEGPAEGFEYLSFKTLKNDVGLALANRSGSIRCEVARRTDTSEKPYSLWVRFNRTF
jgi:hypothetical protein